MIPFGFAISDFIEVGNLAYKIYRTCKNSKTELKTVANEAKTTKILARRFEDEAKDQQSILNRHGTTRQRELMWLVQGLKQALQELGKTVAKYEALRRGEKRIWNSFKCVTKDLSPVRAKLTYYVNAINAFAESLARDCLAQTQKVLFGMMDEVRRGQRPPTFIPNARQGNGPALREIEHELEQKGIAKSGLVKYKMAIIPFLLGCVGSSVNHSLCDYLSANKSQEKEASSDDGSYSDGSSSDDSSSDDSSSDESTSHEPSSHEAKPYRKDVRSIEYPGSDEDSHHDDDSFSEEDDFSDDEDYYSDY